MHSGGGTETHAVHRGVKAEELEKHMSSLCPEREVECPNRPAADAPGESCNKARKHAGLKPMKAKEVRSPRVYLASRAHSTFVQLDLHLETCPFRTITCDLCGESGYRPYNIDYHKKERLLIMQMLWIHSYDCIDVVNGSFHASSVGLRLSLTARRFDRSHFSKATADVGVWHRNIPFGYVPKECNHVLNARSFSLRKLWTSTRQKIARKGW